MDKERRAKGDVKALITLFKILISISQFVIRDDKQMLPSFATTRASP